MDMLKNSYVVFILSFMILSVIVYMFGIGQKVELDEDGNEVSRFNWKYPLAFSMVIWAFWHFYLYPIPGEFEMMEDHGVENRMMGGMMEQKLKGIQRINLANWN